MQTDVDLPPYIALPSYLFPGQDPGFVNIFPPHHTLAGSLSFVYLHTLTSLYTDRLRWDWKVFGFGEFPQLASLQQPVPVTACPPLYLSSQI